MYFHEFKVQLIRAPIISLDYHLFTYIMFSYHSYSTALLSFYRFPVFSLSLSLSVCLCLWLCLCICFCVCLCACLCLCLSGCLCLSLSIKRSSFFSLTFLLSALSISPTLLGALRIE